MSSYKVLINEALAQGTVTKRSAELLSHFMERYLNVAFLENENVVEIVDKYTGLVLQESKDPHQFPLFHPFESAPFDYRTFGLKVMEGIVDFSKSTLDGIANLELIESQLDQGHNVILFANHQTEPDPQFIQLLLAKKFPKLGEKLIFMAGDRVVRDLIAIPFSRGCNLFCIYSKRYIDHPPEQKEEKLQHNQKTLRKMEELFEKGGCFVYVAPSGGRDRPNSEGTIDIAPLDPQSVELFYLIAKRAAPTAHFYPLTLDTFDRLPPPKHVEVDLGEERFPSRGPVHMHFGEELEMEKIAEEVPDKKERRKKRAELIFELIKTPYSNWKSKPCH